MSQKGILGRKLGMTQVFDEANRVVPVTVVEAGPCRVVQLKTPERDGYTAVQLAFGDTKASRLNKPELGHLKAAGGPPQQYLAELRVDDLSNFELGQVIAADVFAAGERVDVTGISKGSGFTGVMKRHNFSGQGASHGNHKKHRSPGAIGACATPARVFKGMKMAGQFGNTRVTTLNLARRRRRRRARACCLIRGSIPGAARRPRVRAQRGEGGGEGMSKLTMKKADGGTGASVDLPDDDLRHRAQRRGDAPGRHRAARRQARRHAQHEDARRGSRRRRQAVAPEGHRPGPSGLDPLAAVARRWRRARPKPRDYSQRTPKKMIRLALAQRALGPRGRGQAHRRRRLGRRPSRRRSRA